MNNADGFNENEFVFDENFESGLSNGTTKSTDDEFVFDENFEKDFKKQKNIKVLAVFASVIFVAAVLCLLFLKPQNKTVVSAISAEIKPPVTSEYKERAAVNESLIAKIPPKRTIFKPDEKFKFVISRKVKFSGNMTDVDFSFEIPSDIVNRQKIYELNIVPKPAKITHSGDKTTAHIFMKNPPQNFTFTISGIASVKAYNLAEAEKTNKNIDGALSDYEREKYLRSEERIYPENDIIRQAAAQIPNSQSEEDTVKNVFDFVVNHMQYNPFDANKVKGSVRALQTGTGVCEEFADLFVSLCRAKGIPARTVAGCDLPFTDYSLSYNSGHKWCEVYLKDYGWVLFDATNNLSKDIFAKFGNTPYEIISQLFKNHLYLKVDVQTIEVTHNGNGNGNIVSENPNFTFSKL